MTVKPVSVQKVNAILRKAGVRMSTSSTTAVKGWHDVSEGYSVWKGYPDGVKIDYKSGTWGSRNPNQRSDMLTQILPLLDAAGVVYERHDRSGLINCTGIKED